MKKELYEKTVGDIYGVVIKLDFDQEKALISYRAEDIAKVIRFYFTKKNSITPPKFNQIIAILETWVDDKKIFRDTFDEITTPNYTTPTTRIYTIKDTYDRLITVLTNAGVIPDSSGKYNNIQSLVDVATNQVMLNPQQSLRWMLNDAIKTRPDLFCKFNNLTWTEGLAIAIQNKILSFKVRNWAKITKTQRINDDWKF